MCKMYIYCAVACTSLSELLLAVSPHSGMFAREWAVARRFSTLGYYVLCVNLSELLLGVSSHSGMLGHEWAVARRFSTLGFYVWTWVSCCSIWVSCCSEILHAWVLCVNLSELLVVARGFSTLRYVCIWVSCCSEFLHTWVLCVNLSELLLGVSPHSGMFASVARSFSTLGFYVWTWAT